MLVSPPRRWSEAQFQLLGLVSGYPEPARKRRGLLMLQAYIDDSRSHNPPLFVLAGYLASVEQWLAFSDDWQAALDASPKIEYFKFREAIRLEKQFLNWSEEGRNEKTARLYSVIEDHVAGSFHIVFNPEHLHAVYGERYGENYQFAKNPFYFAQVSLTSMIARDLHKFEVARQPIDFIFDEQVMEMTRVIEGWKWVRKRNDLKPDPPDMLEIAPNPPTFKNDKRVLPLQAADLLVGWRRYGFQQQFFGKPIPQLWTGKRIIPSMQSEWTEGSIRDWMEKEYVYMLDRQFITVDPDDL